MKKITTIVTILLLIGIGAAAAALKFVSMPDTGIIKAVVSPTADWKAEIELEAYGTFGGANYSIVVSPNRRWFGQFQRNKVFTIDANPDGLQSIDIQWASSKQLTVIITLNKTNVSCKNCQKPSLKLDSYGDIVIKYEEL